MSEAVIKVGSLSVRLGGREILQVERLEVRQGEVVVILGPNGSGKSTLLKCLLGFLRPTAGAMDVLGMALPARMGRSLCALRRQIGYVPQTLAAHSETPLTVREIVAIGRTGIAGVFRGLRCGDWRIVDTWIERLGLADFSQRAYASLSGGEQRKALIAKAMVQQPEILMLDEPTANLDLFWREQIVATLDRLHADSRLTILLVCHEPEVIPQCGQRLLVLRDGRLVADGPPREILTLAMIETLYGSRLELVESRGRFAAAPRGETPDD